MYYGKLNKTDIANGPGVRVSLFVSGCRNRCEGCFNPETWDFKYGQRFTSETIREIIDASRPEYIKGLSILGGDPFEPENIFGVYMLCRRFKNEFPDKTIWVYTGYHYEAFKGSRILKYIDVLVDGPFFEEAKDITLKFRGSWNQRIIDVQKSLKLDTVILHTVER